MPILVESNPLLQRIIKSAPRGQIWYNLDQSLPNFDSLKKAAMGNLGQDALLQDWNKVHAANFGMGSQLQVGSIISKVGAPLNTPLLNGMLNVLNIDDPGLIIYNKLMGFATEILDQALDYLFDILDEIFQEIFSTVFETIGSFPIIGAIFDIALGISQMIIDIIEMKRLKKELGDPEQEFETAGMSPEVDLAIANQRIMNTLHNLVDWTDIFMPPGLAESGQDNFHSIKLPETGGKARRLYAVDGRKSFVGFVPGTQQIDRGWEVNPYTHRTNWPSFVRSETTGKGIGIARSLGSLLPTSRDMGLFCWSQIVGSNDGKDSAPAMFCIDSDAALKAWQEYLYQFRWWLKTGGFGGGLSQWSEVRLTESERQKFVDELVPFYGWGKWGEYDSKKDYAKFGIDQSIPVKNLKNLKARQRAFLHRIDVAYVGPDYGAIKNNYELREIWKRNRQLLLEHPARCKVDITNIPDLEYRNAMQYAQESCIPQHKGTLTSKYEPLPGSNPAPPPIPPAPGRMGSAATRRMVHYETSKKKKGKGGNVVLIALGLGVLALAAKNRK